ncbi:MAG: hypothetical protein KatS3mg010_1407 [Acidimicrobiia bacterium]|nr:MAG: hypothetical protein KatS3mg010_1407 [Acidimicrobiia bacterium]
MGAGTGSPSILTDLANAPALVDAEVVLHDVDRPRAEAMAELGAPRSRAAAGIGLAVRAEPDRRKALAAADFVVTAFSVGGFASMRHDLEVPERYGVVQPVGDSVGPGGIMRALRSIPVLLDVARDVEDVAPGALLLNVTNPLTALCRAVTKALDVPVVGLCNEYVASTFVLSLLLDCGMHQIDAVLAGVNHFPIATAMTVAGEDAFPRLRALLDDEDAQRSECWMELPEQMAYEKVSGCERWTKQDVLANNAVRMELFRRFGALRLLRRPPLDGVRARLRARARRVGTRLARPRVPDGAPPRRCGGRRRALRGAARRRRRAAPVPSGELVVPVIEAVVTGRARRLPVNVPNAGNVGNVPDGAVVEVMATVDSAGVRATDRAVVPGVMGEWLRRVHASQELTVDAALRRRPRPRVPGDAPGPALRAPLLRRRASTMTGRPAAARRRPGSRGGSPECDSPTCV